MSNISFEDAQNFLANANYNAFKKGFYYNNDVYNSIINDLGYENILSSIGYDSIKAEQRGPFHSFAETNYEIQMHKQSPLARERGRLVIFYGINSSGDKSEYWVLGNGDTYYSSDIFSPKNKLSIEEIKERILKYEIYISSNIAQKRILLEKCKIIADEKKFKEGESFKVSCIPGYNGKVNKITLAKVDENGENYTVIISRNNKNNIGTINLNACELDSIIDDYGSRNLMKEPKRFTVGDEIYWNDPDGGLCSGLYKIIKLDPEDDCCMLANAEGSEVEVYVNEISWEAPSLPLKP